MWMEISGFWLFIFIKNKIEAKFIINRIIIYNKIIKENGGVYIYTYIIRLYLTLLDSVLQSLKSCIEFFIFNVLYFALSSLKNYRFNYTGIIIAC